MVIYMAADLKRQSAKRSQVSVVHQPSNREDALCGTRSMQESRLYRGIGRHWNSSDLGDEHHLNTPEQGCML